MAVLSMCVNDVGDLKSGTFFSTLYERNTVSNLVWVTPVNEEGIILNKQEYYLTNKDFYENFVELDYGVYINYYEEIKSTFLSRFKKSKYDKNREETLWLRQKDYDMPEYQKICSKVLIYLLKVYYANKKNNKEMSTEIFTEFQDIIKYSFEVMINAYKNKNILNFDEEIETVAKVFKEIHDYGIHKITEKEQKIIKNKKEALKHLKANHNLLMTSYLNELKEINKSLG